MSKIKHIIRPLPNYLNSCFLNTALQTLFKIKPIRAILNSPTTHNNNRLLALKRLYTEYPIDLSSPFRSQVYGKISADLRRSLNFSISGQQDAIECFLLLLQELLNVPLPETPPLTAEPTLMPASSLDLIFSYSLTCQNCAETTHTEEKGLSIWNSSKVKNIHAHLHDMEQAENQKTNYSDFHCLCNDENKTISKKLTQIKSKDFLKIAFDCKFTPQKNTKTKPIPLLLNSNSISEFFRFRVFSIPNFSIDNGTKTFKLLSIPTITSISKNSSELTQMTGK